MITPHEIYWITRATPAICSLVGIAGLMGFITFITFMSAAIDGEFSANGFFFLFFTIILLASISFIPSTKDLVAIKVLPSILNNENIKNIAPHTAELIDIELQKWVNQNLIRKCKNDNTT